MNNKTVGSTYAQNLRVLRHFSPLNIPKMVANFVRISLHDVEGLNGAGLRMRRVLVPRRSRAASFHALAASISAISPTTGERES